VHEESMTAAWSRGGEGTVFLDSGHGSLQCYLPRFEIRVSHVIYCLTNWLAKAFATALVHQ